MNQLKQGTKIESEHRNTYKKMMSGDINSAEELYKSIAKDHIKEMPDYYTRLNKMEQKSKIKEIKMPEENVIKEALALVQAVRQGDMEALDRLEQLLQGLASGETAESEAQSEATTESETPEKRSFEQKLGEAMQKQKQGE